MIVVIPSRALVLLKASHLILTPQSPLSVVIPSRALVLLKAAAQSGGTGVPGSTRRNTLAGIGASQSLSLSPQPRRAAVCRNTLAGIGASQRERPELTVEIHNVGQS